MDIHTHRLTRTHSHAYANVRIENKKDLLNLTHLAKNNESRSLCHILSGKENDTFWSKLHVKKYVMYMCVHVYAWMSLEHNTSYPTLLTDHFTNLCEKSGWMIEAVLILITLNSCFSFFVSNVFNRLY